MAEDKSISILQSIATQLRLIHKGICELIGANNPTTVGAKLCNGEEEQYRVNSIVQTIPHGDYIQKVQICSVTPDKDYEVVCISNDNGLTIVKGIQEFTDFTTTPPTYTLWLNGIDVTTTYTIVPCETNNKYDYEIKEICVDGQLWNKIYVLDKQGDNIPNLITTIWTDQYDNIVTIPDISLINNINCQEKCEPLITDAYGDDLSTLSLGHSISITKPTCCELLVITTIGTFRIVKGIQSYSTAIFECPVGVTDINILSGNCTLSDVHIIINKLK